MSAKKAELIDVTNLFKPTQAPGCYGSIIHDEDLVGKTCLAHVVPGWIVVFHISGVTPTHLHGSMAWLDGIQGDRATLEVADVESIVAARKIPQKYWPVPRAELQRNAVTWLAVMRIDGTPLVRSDAVEAIR